MTGLLYVITTRLVLALFGGRSRARTVGRQAGLGRFAASKVHKSKGLVLIILIVRLLHLAPPQK
jgi:hypothetical protein